MIWLVLGIIVLSTLGLLLFKRESEKLVIHFNKLASQYNGTVKNPLISYPQLTFQANDTNYLLTCMPSSSTHRSNNTSTTSISFYFDSTREITFRVNSRSLDTIIHKTLGAKTVETLNIDFDKAFLVTTSTPDLVHSILNQTIMDQLLVLRKTAPLSLQIQKIKFFDGSNWVQKPRCLISLETILTDDTAYELLVRTAMDTQRNILNI